MRNGSLLEYLRNGPGQNLDELDLVYIAAQVNMHLLFIFTNNSVILLQVFKLFHHNFFMFCIYRLQVEWLTWKKNNLCIVIWQQEMSLLEIPTLQRSVTLVSHAYETLSFGILPGKEFTKCNYPYFYRLLFKMTNTALGKALASL